ncbi:MULTISPECIES: trifunctional transcriptional regulator/proline dehydrogenase/L-glutamate gamma-semialdehyde dehydrogenase [unclassified Beijerinckia]|uniref:trifunctional transcriptional regulator/proline dehydrogenase/L-glutamate gamma-semialdehyde dehydrogenase n=1 Tax=unclassified Beijerinckia TaxID=2638183 RepID=UPI000899F320|nr:MULTISPECIES: trifunctional transcriptional regulator/proline dehydrogenase/L-glutamate gamma-semialdehyde dehydrogenase [unclassified Beijerinckia]MDH7794928.1 RHH-type proline utilization regulon transcriptional repressor/proline dehydrogenase/delta 1-pyrroline-5-carboxylate dehydrogenase [Beijerinckia sp. GAS462]SEB80742.1 L-proline dehydrogenase /delta-1-pyrroline-5-carboxylate dehydrogenase [Beijerinckia sp. 28-YEA-48]
MTSAEKPVFPSPTQVYPPFAPPILPRSALREAITAHDRTPEAACLAPLLQQASFDTETKTAIAALARKFVTALRSKPKAFGIGELVQEYSLSSEEGVALMCLAEALLRIPDAETRDALIRDKISTGDWHAHLGHDRSLFVNAATWGLVVTGKLTATVNDTGLSASLLRLIHRLGEPVIRGGVDMAMKMMGEQFVIGETIEEALHRARDQEDLGFRYSYDMLGEAALTAEDAARYFKSYQEAIHAIGKASAGRGVYAGPGISIKLSALHPRYQRSQAARVMDELLPRVKALAALAKTYDMGLNIDAEEADRLELSLDLLEHLATDVELAGWNGLGFVVQAYGKRCPYVLDFVIDLARRSGRRLMVRLVKGAYWDAEIKRAQVDGLEDFPVFTRKVHTDVSYIASARKLLDATNVVFPQFATHNAQTLATIYHLAGPEFHLGQYEFQCLHGMGEPLYSEIVGSADLDRPCRIYAPVGTHETLLAYLVRRLLENGANSSFVHKIYDEHVEIDELIRDPAVVVQGEAVPGQGHLGIALPAHLFGDARLNSRGLDLTNENVLALLSQALTASRRANWEARPLLVHDPVAQPPRTLINPGDHADVVGTVIDVSEADARLAVRSAAGSSWSSVPLAHRAACLKRAAELLDARRFDLIPLIMREAGKSAANAVSEIREATDFLRYYAEQAHATLSVETPPLGPVVCISPWNFPLAIFTGQVAAALVAGNAVLAKPAEETPLIAAACIAILHEAGVTRDGLQLVPGDGAIGAALVAAPEVAGVVFTGSTEVAKKIQAQLASRLSAQGRVIPLIAETGGQNAMIVDSSALPEQVVADVLASAFDSAGQRCSALRVLCLQSDVAERIMDMLRGALRELDIGPTDRLSTDVGPVITQEAAETITGHIERMRGRGHPVHQVAPDAAAANGTYVPPTIIEIADIAELQREVFGPVLHVVRFHREDLDKTIAKINATGYGLTFGLHTRIDETIAHVSERVQVGNIYVNRNMIGAVVGVQPFGGRGLSGTGPKAGGPLYIHRLVAKAGTLPKRASARADEALLQFVAWLERKGLAEAARIARDQGDHSPLGFSCALKGPVGESNRYVLQPRGRVLIVPRTEAGLFCQIGAALATGNDIVIDTHHGLEGSLANLPIVIQQRVSWLADLKTAGSFAAVLVEGDGDFVTSVNERMTQWPGPIPIVQAATSQEVRSGADAYCLHWLVEEVATSINTAAAGGNASLLALT